MDASTQSGEAARLAQAAGLVAKSPEPLAFAVVKYVVKAPAPGLAERRWRNEHTGIEMVDRPSRLGFTLEFSGIGKDGGPAAQSVIKWTSDFASNSKYGGHVYRVFREVVKAKPLADGWLICFVPPLQNKDGELTGSISTLPKGTLEALSNAAS